MLNKYALIKGIWKCHFMSTNKQTNTISQDSKRYFRVSVTSVLEFQGSRYRPLDKLTSLS